MKPKTTVYLSQKQKEVVKGVAGRLKRVARAGPTAGKPSVDVLLQGIGDGEIGCIPLGESGYFNTLLEEIANLEKSQEYLKKYTRGPIDLDPNFRLYQGKLHALVSVAKDLADILGVKLDEDFYPTTPGLLED